MSENSPQAPKGSADKVAVADPAQAKSPKKDDKGTESLLDVFTSEELIETPISKLSKDLGDVSVYTLLEQTKQLAQDMKCGR
jgi:hypothetical protein